MTPEEEEEQLARASSAHRAVAPDGSLIPSGAWMDLDEEGRRKAFERAAEERAWEAAADPQGRNATVKAVLARISKTSNQG